MIVKVPSPGGEFCPHKYQATYAQRQTDRKSLLIFLQSETASQWKAGLRLFAWMEEGWGTGFVPLKQEAKNISTHSKYQQQ